MPNKSNKTATEAFLQRRPFKSTRRTIYVEKGTGAICYQLYTTTICKSIKDNVYEFNTDCIRSKTTKDAINCILNEISDEFIYQKNFKWFFGSNDEPVKNTFIILNKERL